MNPSSLQRDLSEYLSIVWSARRMIAAVTVLSVAIMAALTWAVRPIYVVHAEIDTGALALAQPGETNLLLEAIDRSQFTTPGGEFPESMPKGITATWRPPSTIVLDAKGQDPQNLKVRLDALSEAVFKELEKRFRGYARLRASTFEQESSSIGAANSSIHRLRQLFDERTTSSLSLGGNLLNSTGGVADARASFQRDAERRLFEPLDTIRRDLEANQPDKKAEALSVGELLAAMKPNDNPSDPESIFVSLGRQETRLAALGRVIPLFQRDLVIEVRHMLDQLGQLDNRVARAEELRRSIQFLLQRDQPGITLLTAHPSVTGVADAQALKEKIDELLKAYGDEPGTARAISDTSAALASVIDAVKQAQHTREDLPGLARTPKISVPPSVPPQPTWPRPPVNLAIAFVFGLAASTTYSIFGSRLRALRTA